MVDQVEILKNAIRNKSVRTVGPYKMEQIPQIANVTGQPISGVPPVGAVLNRFRKPV
jgi:hypothetical protein